MMEPAGGRFGSAAPRRGRRGGGGAAALTSGGRGREDCGRKMIRGEAGSGGDSWPNHRFLFLAEGGTDMKRHGG